LEDAMKEVNFTLINVDGLEIEKTFASVNEFVSNILFNGDVNSAISLDDEIKNYSIETAILDSSYFRTVNDLFMFCKGIVYARAV
jgi:hypothetical protein